jgi:integral membrane protein (TIGR01906 family)
MAAPAEHQSGVTATLSRWLYWNLAGLFVLCLPLFSIASNVRRVTLDPGTYRQGFEKYAASQRTGFAPTELERIGQEFIRYFEGPGGRLEPLVTIGGQRRPLFNEREIVHMEDVQKLMQLVFRLGDLSGAYLLVFMAGLLITRRRAGLRPLGGLLLAGAGLSLGLLVLVGAASFADFSELFVRFHEMSFSNDLWQLDPEHDYLLMLFPEEFWLEVTLRIGALTAVEAAALGLLGFLLFRRSRPAES